MGSEATIAYHENDTGTGGSLIVSDDAHTVELTLQGTYTLNHFSVVHDQTAGARIAYVQHDLLLAA